MVFLPHTNTVILLEPYCGTITEPGLPVLLQAMSVWTAENKRQSDENYTFETTKNQ